jgi:hypothetical protein
LQRKLPTHSLFETYQKDFLFYQQVLAQQPKDKNKIYSLHEPIDDFNGKFGIGGVGDVFFLYGGVNQYARLLGLFTKALTCLRTIANKLIRELQRKLPTHSLFETYQKDFLFYQQVLAQQPKDKNKIYSLDLRCPIIGSIAARLLHSLRFLSR